MKKTLFFLQTVLLGINLISNPIFLDEKPMKHIDFSKNLETEKKVYVIPKKPESHKKEISTSIVFPRAFESKKRNPVHVQLSVSEFLIGCKTEKPNVFNLHENPNGQAIRIIVDNNPYMTYSYSFDDDDIPHNNFRLASFSLPQQISSGPHSIRCFPVYSFGESVKSSEAFSNTVFFLKENSKLGAINIDLEKPYLTYNEPQGRYPYINNQPILLDFLLSNCDLSKKGYKVLLTINDKDVSYLTSYCPYLIYGLDIGTHQLRLRLLDENNEVVAGVYNDVEHSFVIEKGN